MCEESLLLQTPCTWVSTTANKPIQVRFFVRSDIVVIAVVPIVIVIAVVVFVVAAAVVAVVVVIAVVVQFCQPPAALHPSGDFDDVLRRAFDTGLEKVS